MTQIKDIKGIVSKLPEKRKNKRSKLTKGGEMKFTIEITNPKEDGFMPDEHIIYQCITSPVQINGYIINITREVE